MKLLPVALLLIISACADIPSTEPDTGSLSPPSPYYLGAMDSRNFISTFESNFGYPFGGDGSIVLWISHFNIPCSWPSGSPVTTSQLSYFNPAYICFKSHYDFSRFTPYLYGVISAI